MNKEENYSSDSDQSDQDFCPENAAGDSDIGSESKSDEEYSENNDSENETKTKKGTARKGSNGKIIKEKQEHENRRTTRQADNELNTKVTKRHEKDELDSDEEEDKSRVDALWADFLGDSAKVKKPNKVDENSKSPSGSAKENDSLFNGKRKLHEIETDNSSEKIHHEGDTTKIRETFLITNELSSASPRRQLLKATGLTGVKRPRGLASASAGGADLGSILNNLGKKKKLSVLEKSQLDWKSFKQNEGIEEQLQTHNKGKDGFLERQDFLQRTDLRQFEIEKGMRQARRQN